MSIALCIQCLVISLACLLGLINLQLSCSGCRHVNLAHFCIKRVVIGSVTVNLSSLGEEMLIQYRHLVEEVWNVIIMMMMMIIIIIEKHDYYYYYYSKTRNTLWRELKLSLMLGLHITSLQWSCLLSIIVGLIIWAEQVCIFCFTVVCLFMVCHSSVYFSHIFQFPRSNTVSLEGHETYLLNLSIQSIYIYISWLSSHVAQ